MIDIQLYRYRIGTFRQKIRKLKVGRLYSEKIFQSGFLHKWLKMFLIMSVVVCTYHQWSENQENCQNKSYVRFASTIGVGR